MYIAFRWLLILSLLMWVSLCFIESFQKKFNDHKSSDSNEILCLHTTVANNTTQLVPTKTPRERKFRIYPQRHCDVALLRCLLFFSGALAGTIYYRKKALLSYFQNKCNNIGITISELPNYCRLFHLYLDTTKLKETAIKIGAAILQTSLKTGDFFKKISTEYQDGNKKHETSYTLELLVKKVKDIAEERNNLANILTAVIEAHKSLKMRYKTQEITNVRLLRRIEDAQKQYKENRAKLITFYRIHMLTEQDNLFLKACVKRLEKEKYETQNNLWNLVNLIYQSKNKELQDHCNGFIINSNDRLISSSVIGAEMQRVLGKIRPLPPNPTSGKKPTDMPSCRMNTTKSSTSTRITEGISEDESFVFLKPDGPKLRGLPGECIWTVKDNNGLIEKLYEYEYGYKYIPDTIQRIRKYSVYHDKDCLLDFSKSTKDTSRNKFLTESQPFQIFMNNNCKKLVSTTCPRPHLKLLSR